MLLPRSELTWSQADLDPAGQVSEDTAGATGQLQTPRSTCGVSAA